MGEGGRNVGVGRGEYNAHLNLIEHTINKINVFNK